MIKKIFSALLIILFHPCNALDFEIKTTRTLTKNISYSIYTSPTIPLLAHVLKIPKKDLTMKLIPAIGQREEVSSIAKRNNAFIAINGSNYRRGGKFNGNRVNLFYINNQIITDLGLTRGSLICDNSKNIDIDMMYLKVELYINNQFHKINQINQPRGLGQSVLYTDVADISLLAHNSGINIIINPQGSITQITYELPTKIEPNYYVYQVGNDPIQKVEAGMQATFSFEPQFFKNAKAYKKYDFILGGAGVLIQNGKIVTDALYEEFSQGKAIIHCGDEVAADFNTKEMQQWLIELRHPRTAIGITKNNELYIVVVDGRQTISEGLSLHELGSLMHQLGCVRALNIGGGGCSTLVIDGKIINSPSAGEERPVSEALCFYK